MKYLGLLIVSTLHSIISHDPPTDGIPQLPPLR